VSAEPDDRAAPEVVATTHAEPEAPAAAEPGADAPARAPSLLDAIEASATEAPRFAPGLRAAKLLSLDGARALVDLRGGVVLDARLADDVERELVLRALDAGDRVLVEIDERGEAEIVGVVATRVPRTLHLEADRIVIDASEELTLRSGKAGLRLREDGEVELVGSRIAAVSRGLFRLVGKMLRLN
jgi:hypothetical protein